MSDLPDWFTPSNDDGKTQQVQGVPGSNVIKSKDGTVKVLGWRELHVTCPSGFLAGIYYDKDGVLKVMVKKDDPNYEWPDGINPIQGTVHQLKSPNNTLMLSFTPEEPQ